MRGRKTSALHQVLRVLSPRGLQQPAPVDDEGRARHEVGARRGRGPRRRRRPASRSGRAASRRPGVPPGPDSTATGPGAMPQTRTSGASARAKTRVSIACAAFAARMGRERWPRLVGRDVLDHHDHGPRLSRRCCAAAWVTKKLPLAVGAERGVPVRSRSRRSTGLGTNPSPAAFTSRSSPPSSSTARVDERRGTLCPGEVAVGSAGREDASSPRLGDARKPPLRSARCLLSRERASRQCRHFGSVHPVGGSN